MVWVSRNHILAKKLLSRSKAMVWVSCETFWPRNCYLGLRLWFGFLVKHVGQVIKVL